MTVVVGTTEVLGRTLTINVSSTGHFTLTAEDEDRGLGFGMSLDAARDQARRKLAEARIEVSVPFIVVEREGRGAMKWRRGTARGIHAKRGSDVLVTFEDGRKGTLGYAASVWKPDTDEATLNEYCRQETIAAEARERAHALKRDGGLELAKVVREAVDRAALDSLEKVES